MNGLRGNGAQTADDSGGQLRDPREVSSVRLKSPAPAHYVPVATSAVDVFEAELAAQRADGLATFHPLAFAFIERLTEFARAREAGRGRLLSRARSRLELLQAEAQRAARKEQLAAASGNTSTRVSNPAGLPAPAALPIEANADLVPQMEQPVAPKETQPRPAGETQEQTALKARLSSRLVARGSTPPPSMDALELAERLYNARVGDVHAGKLAETFRDGLPEESGPYHSATVAAAALEILHQQAPELLRAWLQRLQNLALAAELDATWDKDGE